MSISNSFIVNIFRELGQLPIWWYQAFHKRDPRTWVFGSWYANSYSDNAKTMFEYVLSNHPEINAVWVTGNKNIYNKLHSEGKPVALKGTKESKRVSLKAGYVFITVMPRDMEHLYINGAVQVWLWHGMPLKMIGKDKKNYDGIKGNIHRAFPQNRYKPDYFINLSHKWDPVLNRAFSIRKEILITGLPRNDRFFMNKTESCVLDVNQKFNNPVKILYMPTFRDDLMENGEPFNPFKSFGFSMDKFNELLAQENAVFFFKGHFYDLRNQHSQKAGTDRFIILNDSMYDDLYSFIKDVDILITDYSSIYFDFLIMKKPVILTPFDKEDYCHNSRNMYFDYEKEIVGIRAYNWNDVMDIIRDKKYYVPEQKVIDGFHEFQDGNSTKRITEYFLNKIQTV